VLQQFDTGQCYHGLIKDSATTVCFNVVIFIKIKRTLREKPPCGCPEKNMTDKTLMKKMYWEKRSIYFEPNAPF
jgi:hypothetical protein